MKGDGSTVVKMLSPKTQREALRAVLKTLDIKEIAIPKDKLNLFPPRALGYSRSRESFKSKAGVAFDPFAAVETSANMTLNLLLHPERVVRLVQHQAIDKNQPGFEEILDTLIKQTFNKSYKDLYYQELQNVVNVQVLDQLY